MCRRLTQLINPIHNIYSSTEVDSTERVSPRSRIMGLVRVVESAVRAATVCFPMLFAAHPRTPLRVLGITTFEYLARLRGTTLGRRRRYAMALACDFASLRDDYYDHKTLDVAKLRSLRRELRGMVSGAAILRYTRHLRYTERNRPVLPMVTSGVREAAIAYRARVLDLTLQWLNTISGMNVDELKYCSFLDVACLLQIADDLLDWKDDQALQCPSYVTVFLLNPQSAEAATSLRSYADALLNRTKDTARQDADAVPFAIAAALTWAFIIALLRVQFPR